MNNKSPLRYPGGKTRAIHILESYVNQYYPERTTIISPFFGGGSFELYMTTKGYNVFANDLFTPLYTFWKVKKDDCERLISKIRAMMPVSKEVFYNLRSSIMNTEDDYEKAASFFIINRTSFSGATLSGGYSKQAAENRLTESSIQRLHDCDVGKITFTALDCLEFMEKYPESSSALIYADPPYYIDKYIYGKDGDMHDAFNHEQFAQHIQKRNDWIISYNDCEYIRTLYSNCRIFEAKWSYGMNKTKRSSEIIILPPIS